MSRAFPVFSWLEGKKRATMVSGKRMADMGYRLFSGSMMLLTVYGGYLCVMRGHRYMQRQKQLQLEAENQTNSD
ncbi:hypothetical protein SKAU_G00154280 [Synaphobranchus kaupii]|uniref:Cytochrome c oxidase assembly protein COX14 homolog n=1 Tax=Synaphobranchus kaupii TaxID=118154 RepID=A0A9Q1FHF0_SYNKA|nr:hypothetical protein SKAU_G00154280 [Synaphobranchus kaupii]